MSGRLLPLLALCGAALVASCRAGHATVRAEVAPPASTTSTIRAATTPTTAQPCTHDDIQARPITVMPTPESLGTPLTLEDGNDTLSPPDSRPAVSAAQAWAKVMASGFGPRSSGTARLVLADLAAKTPATIQNYAWPPTSDHPDTETTPMYTHILVWVVIGTDQAEVSSGGGSHALVGTATTATTVPQPLCFLETAVSYVDATTGVMLMAQNF